MTRGCLSLSNVKVRRGGRTILDVESVEIRQDEFVGIIGTNGAGKTTLLKVCCGLIRADSGTVRFDGHNFHQLSAWRKAELTRRIGYIPQAAEYNAELPFTLRELVAMGRTSVRGLLSRLNRKDYEIIDGWIDSLGLAQKRRQTFRSLSGGEQQKGLIARAMAQDPELLVLDEPCSNLDFNWKYQITELIDRLHRETSLTVLMVSHETSQLPSACKRVLLLHEGNVLADGDIEQVLESEEFDRAYRCPSETLKIGGRRYTVKKDSA